MSIDLKDQDYSTLYVELDCLLDTRFSTLFSMGEEVAKKVIDFDYHERVTDFFPGIDYEAYQKAYDARNKLTLKNAMVTPVLQLIHDFAKSTLENASGTPFQYEPKLELNIYPYKLDEDEIKLILSIVYGKTGKMMAVEVINKSPEEITPYFVKSRYSVMVMYRYDQWLEIHAKNKKFEKTTVPEVTLLSPAVYFLKQDKIPEDVKSVFEDMQRTAAPLIGLQLLPADVFSMSVRIKKASPPAKP